MKTAAPISILVLLLAAHVFLGLGPIRQFSATYDEPVHLTAGYIYWRTGNYGYNGMHHPPLGEMWSALPLLFMKPILPLQHPAWLKQSWSPINQYTFADTFLYHNRVPADRLMFWGRVMQLALSCLLGLLMAWVAFSLGGWRASLLAAGLWAFSPVFLTAGTLVTTDLAFALFYFAFFSFLLRAQSPRMQAAAGISLGLCFASKYFALAIGPAFIGVWGWNHWAKKENFPWRLYLIAAIGAVLSVALVYRFSGLEMFFAGLGEIFHRSQSGRSSFFWGQHGTQGWLSYFPFVFLVKTPIPVLIGLVLSVLAAAWRKIKIPAEMWIPPLVFFAISCFSKVQIGHRHILAVYPFVLVLASLGLNALPGRSAWLSLPLGGWLVMGTWNVRPNFIAYFNELIGGPGQGYNYLTDSNVDWGQELKELGDGLSTEERERGIYLCYFGVADPHHYGIRYLGVGSESLLPRQDDTALMLKPTTFAISATNLQATYYADKTIFDWLKKIQPIRVIGHGLFVYDLSSHPEGIAILEMLRK